jgi:hypothetical protein
MSKCLQETLMTIPLFPTAAFGVSMKAATAIRRRSAPSTWSAILLEASQAETHRRESSEMKWPSQ